MAEESTQAEVYDLGYLFIAKDKNTIRRSLNRVLGQYLLQQLHTSFLMHLVLDHVVEEPVHDGQEGANFLVGEGILAAELIVDEVEVEDQLVDSVDLVRWLFHDGV